MSGAPELSFWQGRKVFLTGHTGFKGSWLCLWLEALGAEVTGYALAPPTEPNLFEAAGAGRALRESVEADVRDLPRLVAAVADCRPSVVIHMAAQSVVRRGYSDPVETYSSNVMGTVHILEAVRRLGGPCAVVNVTSDKCYENRESEAGYHETDPLGGRDPYSNSKACSELVTAAYRDSFFRAGPPIRAGIALASARAGNVVGGGDWTENQLVPDLVRSFRAGLPCPVRSPKAVRPWQFVLEPLRGYLSLAEKLIVDPEHFASAWNFGPDEADAWPVHRIAEELAKGWGHGASWIYDDAVRLKETGILKLDHSKARLQLGWKPVLPLDKALEWVLEWYLAFAGGADVVALSRAQVARYEALAAGRGKV